MLRSLLIMYMVLSCESLRRTPFNDYDQAVKKGTPKEDISALVSKVKSLAAQKKSYTVQAMCHSYSGVNQRPPAKKAQMSVLNILPYRDFKLNVKDKVVTVRPGTRFIDMIDVMASAKLTLPMHGDFHGQTVIGAISTGTHGSGLEPVHHWVKRMWVINAEGSEQTLIPGDEEFPAWLNSIGLLGVILEMDIQLVDDFNLRKVETWIPLEDAIKGMLEERMSQVNWPMKGNAAFLNNTRTNDPVTMKKCCYPLDFTQGNNVPPAIISYANDFAWALEGEPAEPIPYHCKHTDPFTFEGIFGKTKYPSVSVDVNVSPEDLSQAMKIMGNTKWPKDTTVMLRYIKKDGQGALLSPYMDGPRISMDLGVGGLRPRSIKENIQLEEEAMAYDAALRKFMNGLDKAGIEWRYHVGKTGLGTVVGNFGAVPVRFWHQGRLDEFIKIKKRNDPNNRLTNTLWDQLMKKHK